MLAARNGDLALLERALQAGINVNSRSATGQTPLMEVAPSRNAECVRALIAAGADVNAQDSAGRTPLMWAAEFQFRGGLNLLLSHGADVNARNRKGQTVLAYIGRHPGLIRLLRSHGARQ
jgi:ankyrin repeat protein